MATLLQETADIKAKQTAGQLINNKTKLDSQLTAAQSDVTKLKAELKTEIAADTWNTAKMVQLVQAVEMQSRIITKFQSIKTQLTEIKADLLSAAHQTELQTEIDKI